MGERLSNLFEKFDTAINERPLYAVAEVDKNNQLVKSAKTPFKMLVRAQDFGHKDQGGGDFREEIMNYAANQMKFDILVQMLRDSEKQEKVGTLTFGTPFMSETCDQELHFHHHRNNRN